MYRPEIVTCNTNRESLTGFVEQEGVLATNVVCRARARKLTIDNAREIALSRSPQPRWTPAGLSEVNRRARPVCNDEDYYSIRRNSRACRYLRRRRAFREGHALSLLAAPPLDSKKLPTIPSIVNVKRCADIFIFILYGHLCPGTRRAVNPRQVLKLSSLLGGSYADMVKAPSAR